MISGPIDHPPWWNDPGWWTAHGLEGLAGGLITGLLVAWTLRHERRAARLASAREAAGELMEATAEFANHIEDPEIPYVSAYTSKRPEDETNDFRHEYQRLARVVAARARRLEALTARDCPGFAKATGLNWRAMERTAEDALFQRGLRPSVTSKLEMLDHVTVRWMKDADSEESFWTRLRHLRPWLAARSAVGWVRGRRRKRKQG